MSKLIEDRLLDYQLGQSDEALSNLLREAESELRRMRAENDSLRLKWHPGRQPYIPASLLEDDDE